MNADIKTTNKIPSYLALLFSTVILILFCVPYSRYSLLSAMTDGKLDSANPNWSITIPAILTVFLILFIVAIFLLALVSCFYDTIYGLRTISLVLLCISVVSCLVEIGFFITFILAKTETGKKLFVGYNVIPFVFSMLFYIAYPNLFYFYVEKPYQVFKASIENKIETEVKENYEKKKKTEETAVSSAKEANDELRDFVLHMLSEGKITEEQAKKMLDNIDK